jgi:glycerol-1-phosphate dehydrogenase [NAD(P)+]
VTHAPREIATPRLLHMGDECIASVPQLLAEHEFDLTRVLVGTGAGATRDIAADVTRHLRDAGHEVVERDCLAGRLDQAGELAGEIVTREATVVLGVGGGRVIDTAKLAAGRTGTEFVSVPTAISHDGISSPIASLSHDDGVRRSHAATMPAGIVVDTQIIRNAPARMIRAGVGDLASNLTANLDWQLAHRRGADRYDAFSALIAESAARPALEIEDIDDPDGREWIAKGLLMSGLAMAAAGTSRPCSGAEHLISHSLDSRLGERAALHGEQVALGCLVAAAAHRSELLETLDALFARLGLPRRPSDLDIGDDEFLEAVRTAPETRPGRYTILSELDRDPSQVIEEAFGGPG